MTSHLKPTYTEISATALPPRESAAPNGSARCIDHWTIVTLRQDWPVDESLGVYSGRSYRITERWLSLDPAHRGQYISSSSTPWEG